MKLPTSKKRTFIASPPPTEPAKPTKPAKEQKSTITKSTSRKSNTDNNINALGSDEYKDLIPAREVILNAKNKLVISVKRGGKNGLPRVDIRLFVTSDHFSDFTKKGVNFDLSHLPELKAIMCDVIEECSDLNGANLFDEFEDEEEEE